MTHTPKYVLRGGIPNDFPQYSVVRLNDDMGGTTVAFFYRLRDAKKYMAWMNGKHRK